ncbi:MAG TPA: hypothetical protein V6C71_24830 [Coleofasciculaceae cyanobacterium]
MVRAVLDRQQLTNRVTAIYAGEVDTTELFLRAYCEIESDTELVESSDRYGKISCSGKNGARRLGDRYKYVACC